VTQENLSVAFVLQSAHIPAWQFAMIASIAGANDVSTCVLTHPDQTPAHRGAKDSSAKLFEAFRRHEERRQKVSRDACARMLVAELPSNVERICVPIDRHRGFDVVVALGSLANIDELSEAAKYGVWFYEHSSNQTSQTDGTSLAFWEVIRRRPYVWTRLLMRQAGSPADSIVYETYSGVHHLSHQRSRNEHLWKLASIIPRLLRRLRVIGHERFLDNLRNTPRLTRLDVYGNRNQLSIVRLFIPILDYLVWRLVQKSVRKLYTERWILMFSTDREQLVVESLRKLMPPADRFWADPFAIFREGRCCVFFEDASLETGHGRLSVMTMSGDGQFSPPVTVLERPYHLSYPFIFEWKNSLYLIPESADNRTVELYRCTQFPDKWEFQHNLMEDVRVYDSTLFEHEGTWWLFATVQERDGASSWDELCLFYADHPLSTAWHAHPMNPVISDVRLARPAGRMFTENGRIYRPSQNSSFRYGYALNINEVLELNRITYRERLIETFVPDWDRSITCMHTYTRAGHLTVVDAFHRARKLRTVWSRSESRQECNSD
jgi:hypothetical protein